MISHCEDHTGHRVIIFVSCDTMTPVDVCSLYTTTGPRQRVGLLVYGTHYRDVLVFVQYRDEKDSTHLRIPTLEIPSGYHVVGAVPPDQRTLYITWNFHVNTTSCPPIAPLLVSDQVCWDIGVGTRCPQDLVALIF